MNAHPEILGILHGKLPWPRELQLFDGIYSKHYGDRRDRMGRAHFEYDFIPKGFSDQLWHWLLLVDYACLSNPLRQNFDRYEVLKVVLESSPAEFNHDLGNRVSDCEQRIGRTGSAALADWLHVVSQCFRAEALYASNRELEAFDLLMPIIERVNQSFARDEVGLKSLVAYLASRSMLYLLAVDEGMCLAHLERMTAVHPKALAKFFNEIEDADLRRTSADFQNGLCQVIETTLLSSGYGMTGNGDYRVINPLVRVWSLLQPDNADLVNFVVSYLNVCDSDFAHTFTRRLSDPVRHSPNALDFQARLMKHVLEKLRGEELGTHNRNSALRWRVELATKTLAQSQRLFPDKAHFLEFAEKSMVQIAQRDIPSVSGSLIEEFLRAYDQDILNPYSCVENLSTKLEELSNAQVNWGWIALNQCDELIHDHRHEPFRGHLPCNLEVLKTMLWASQNSGKDIYEAHRLGLIGRCPIHSCSELGVQIFLRENFRDLSVSEFTSRGMTRLQTLAANCQPFHLSEDHISFLTKGNKFEIHPWQWKALHSWAAHGRVGIVSAATGAGKSLIGAATLLEAMRDNYANWLLVHRRILKTQWYESALGFGGNPSTGPVSPFSVHNVNQLDPEKDTHHDPALKPQPGQVLIALPISLQRRGEIHPTRNESNFVLVDEVHNFNNFFRDNDGMGGAFGRRLGISATIDLRDQSVLNHIGDEVFDYQLAHAIEDKVVARYKLLCIRFSHGLDELDPFKLENARLGLKQRQESLKQAGFTREADEDYYHAINRLIKDQHPDFGKLAYGVAQAKSIFDAQTSGTQGLQILPHLEPYLQQHGHALIFSNSRSVGQEITNNLLAHQIAAGYLDGEDAVSLRVSEIERLKYGELKVLVAPQVLDEGIDIPSARTAVILGVGNFGYRQVLQRAGRVLRRDDGQATPVIIITAATGGADDPNLGLEGTSFGQLSKHIPKSEARLVDFEDLESTKADLAWAFSD